jgi:hypothetical protein
MNNTRVRTLVRVAVAATAATLLLVGTASPAAAADVVPLGVNDLPTIVNNLRGWVLGLLAAVATLFLTVGGVRYLLAGGDPAEVERAKSAFKSAGVGYVLALIAPVVLTILNQIIGA